MLQGKRFVICGLSRLAVRVARSLVTMNATVTLVHRDADGHHLLGLLGAEVQIVKALSEDDAEALRLAGITEAACLLALDDDDLNNLRVAVSARDAAPEVPVVLRAFDPALADQLEQGLNIRRAYSVSALAAPAFVAAACGDHVLETLRLAEGEVPFCRMTVRPGSPLAGKTIVQIKTRYGCGVLARADSADDWRSILGDGNSEPLAVGCQILIGGPLPYVLRLICFNIGWLSESRKRPRRSHKLFRPSHDRRLGSHPTRLPFVAAALFAVLTLSVAVFARVLKLSLIDAIYFVITTATTTGYGDISLKDAPDWVKIFGCLVMITGGALLGVLFSYFAAQATAERLDEMMGQRASRMSGHIVLAGLGNLGYRVAQHLTDLGLDVAVIELSPDARFVEAVRARAPVLGGDASLPENLERASIRNAAAFIACTNDDLRNIQACLHARRLNPDVTTVARVFDDTLAARLTHAFTIDQALSASQISVGAFVGAATDERALRPISVGALHYLACRYLVQVSIPAAVLTEWRNQGIRLLAFRSAAGQVQPPSDVIMPLEPGCELILCGPAKAIRAIFSPELPVRN